MDDDAAMLRATANAIDGDGMSPIWWLAQAIELRALADRLDQGLCTDPSHSEPFACYRQAEGGFTCESTHRLETLVTAVRQLEHLIDVSVPASAIDELDKLLGPALVSLFNLTDEMRS